jgi:pantoate--beta-alanine ligase
MKTTTTCRDTQQWVSDQKNKHCSIGFVPTMGALHSGHLSLIKRSKQENDVTACSIFVNPKQFNNKADLEKYPRTPEHDLKLLSESGCDLVFVPTVEEIYPDDRVEHDYFGALEEVMEGAFRPGHFAGVVNVVKRLFAIVQPDKAYFGKKDFQQTAIIKALVRSKKISTTIVACPIVRETDGLAMSSRNQLLTLEERAIAPRIHQILENAITISKEKTISEVENFVISEITKEKKFKLEYFKIVDNDTLQDADTWNHPNGLTGCIALWLGNVRLIDNIDF